MGMKMKAEVVNGEIVLTMTPEEADIVYWALDRSQQR